MEIHPDHVIVIHEGASNRVDTNTVIWAAGVKASMLGKKLADAIHAPDRIDRSGRIAVDSQCAVAGHPNIFVTGDMAAFSLPDAKTLPGVALYSHYVSGPFRKSNPGTVPMVLELHHAKSHGSTYYRSR